MPELLKSQAKSSTGGGSDQYESVDVQETSTVNTMRAAAVAFISATELSLVPW